MRSRRRHNLRDTVACWLTAAAIAVGVAGATMFGELDGGGWTERSPADATLRDWDGSYVVLTIRHPYATGLQRLLIEAGVPERDVVAVRHNRGRPETRSAFAATYGPATDGEAASDQGWAAANWLTRGAKVHKAITATVVGPGDQPALREGDRIVTIDGRRYTPATITRLRITPNLDEITAGVLRDGDTVDITLRTINDNAQGGADDAAVELARRFGIWATVVPVIGQRPQLRIPPNESGPSSGLINALVYTDMLTDGDLTGSRRIAGTGTIDTHGNVGNIGGLPQKVSAAISAGAAVMFVPDGQADEARELAGGAVDVVGVDTLDDAVAWLCAHTADHCDWWAAP